jgi:superfamily I DNA/RNA helicase
MGLTEEQKAKAEAQQWVVARDTASQVRLVAGPGTGKTYAIQKKVLEVLKNGATPENVYVISFTRATCAELRSRITKFCLNEGYGAQADSTHISTMHSLGLRILRRGNQLTNFPCEPTVLDDWEQNRVYDIEYSSSGGGTPTRAKRIRQAHDAAWDTLNPKELDERGITDQEKLFFNQFHRTRTNLYSCLLPGEIIFKCVEALELGSLQESQLPVIEHLIVDEYQDLNKCDQKFIKLLCNRGAKLFVAGDDDQSIYATLRHAHPAGIVHFGQSYPEYSAHELTDCFRCTPAIVDPALRLIAYNPDRVAKQLIPLYGSAEPPVNGYLTVWSYQTAEDEARAVALSCKQLIDGGMKGQESQILILISNRRVQLDVLTREFANLGLPFDAPISKTTEDDAIRVVYYLLRIVRSLKELQNDKPPREKKLDYPAYRALFCLLSGVGPTTAKDISKLCIQHLSNYHDLFHLTEIPHWLTGRVAASIGRMRQIVARLSSWELTDSLRVRGGDIVEVLRNVYAGSNSMDERLAVWLELASSFSTEIQLNDLIEYFGAFNESDKEVILKMVNERIGVDDSDAASSKERKIRILTMHGAKGLAGMVVFIPSASSGIMPSFRAIHAPGLLIEQRRLFYVSMTRAKAACIISHATKYTGAPAQALDQKSAVYLTRSEFLNEMRVVSTNKEDGFTTEEVQRIMADINNL